MFNVQMELTSKLLASELIKVLKLQFVYRQVKSGFSLVKTSKNRKVRFISNKFKVD